eukprot:scaffold106504_cov61-Phaeocystis_antarctica.AAC.4
MVPPHVGRVAAAAAMRTIATLLRGTHARPVQPLGGERRAAFERIEAMVDAAPLTDRLLHAVRQPLLTVGRAAAAATATTTTTTTAAAAAASAAAARHPKVRGELGQLDATHRVPCTPSRLVPRQGGEHHGGDELA